MIRLLLGKTEYEDLLEGCRLFAWKVNFYFLAGLIFEAILKKLSTA